MGSILAGLVMVLLALGEAVPAQVPEQALPQRRHVVEVRGFGFHPYRTIASPGDTVVWINRDVVPHTATARVGTWNSQELAEGNSWELVVRDQGRQSYFCEFHPHMEGVLEVRATLKR